MPPGSLDSLLALGVVLNAICPVAAVGLGCVCPWSGRSSNLGWTWLLYIRELLIKLPAAGSNLAQPSAEDALCCLRKGIKQVNKSVSDVSLKLMKVKLVVSVQLQLPRKHVLFPLNMCSGDLEHKTIHVIGTEPELCFEPQREFCQGLTVCT